MVAVDVGHTITMFILQRLHLFLIRILFFSIHLHTIIVGNQHIRLIFHSWGWRNKWVDYTIEAMNINLKLLDLANKLLLPLLKLYGLPSSLEYCPDPSGLFVFSKTNNLIPLSTDAM